MDAVKKFLKTWKHDILAGSFAVLSMALLLQQLLLGGSAPIAADTAVAASPASFGISTETPDAPDRLARASETSQRSKAEPSPDNDERGEAIQHAKAPSGERRQESSDSKPPENSPTESEVVKQPYEVPQDSTPAPDNAQESMESPSEQLAVADPSLKANEVEEKPKPVEEMTAEDLEKARHDYETWVQNGHTRLVLKWALSPEQLNSVVALYVVETDSTTLGITPKGVVNHIASQGIPDGKLIGDLPLDRSNWPAIVVKRAGEWLGPSYAARNANFLLTDACALQLYRTLAHEVGKDKSRPGAEYVLRLVARGGQIQVQLVRHN